ncbi:MAG: zinc-binding dehydrogenase [Defluviicoccus sp.]|nr:zinc-binding dehydrogenase [Defluviicoccus sp.]MDE0276787.1 zinc-binding dehydrogenase [Defluviicoccus sp.]
MKARAMVQIAARRLEMEEFEVPRVGASEGLLRVAACGLCGSDVEQYRGHFAEKGLAEYPVIPGHEPVGTIEELGADAEARWGVKAGDRVALQPVISCGRCADCLSGAHHLCKGMFQMASPAYGYLPTTIGHGLWGGYGEYIHLHERTLMHRLPDNVPDEMATMYQALAAGIRWAVAVPGAGFSDTVLVMGCGQRGLASVVALKAAGVSDIVVTGLKRDAFKLRLAREFGATHTVVADEEDTIDRIMEITGGRGVDIAVDVVPTDTRVIGHAVEVVRPGGTIVVAGVKGGSNMATLDTDRMVYKELTLKAVFTQGADMYRAGIDLLARNLEHLAPMHTHEMPLEQAERAIQMVGGEIPGEEAICISLHP